MKTVSGLKQFQLFLLLLLLFIAPSIYAQELPDGETTEVVSAEDESNTEEAEPEVVLPPGFKNLEMEIRTSSLAELAAWCRILGLSEGGDVYSLRERLRSHFELPSPTTDGSDKRKVITIESARSTEYFKIEEVDEEYARLVGDVRVTLKDGESIHEIKAWEILFNRTRNIITASGGVEYVKSETGKPTEIFRGDSITVNIDNWSSVFLGGSSERTFQGGENDTAYLFSGTVISRNDEDTTVLNKATISSAQNKEALWSLSASRVWLLPGSDFAVLNALLKVGEFPVFYLPFFYYPADEVIFHPALGYRPREGNYVQTTTYLIGRPPPTEKTSLAKMLGNSTDMEKKREGMFLRSTGKTPQTQNDTRLKLMADYYANLGLYTGIDFVMPKLGILDSLDLGISFARTRTISPLGNGYTPFDEDGRSDWNKSNLFSQEVPFRYNFKFNSSIKGRYGAFSWNIPYYSDPFIDRDFSDRKEEMDWVNLMEQGATAFEGEFGTDTTMGAPMWQLTGNLNVPRFPALEPYVNSITVSGNSSMTFGTRQSKTQSIDSPTSYFFFPNNATLYSINTSISGAPLNLGVRNTAANSAKKKDEEVPNPFAGFGEARSPWSISEEESTPTSGSADDLVPPVLEQAFNLPDAGDFRFKMDYSLSPSASSALQFRASDENWKEYQDIKWSEVESVVSTFGTPVRVTLNFNHTSDFYSGAFTFQGTGKIHQINFLDEESETFLTGGVTDPNKVRNAKETQYRQTGFSTSYGLNNTIRPLYKNDVFGQSNLRYDLTGLAVRSNFVGMNGDDPEWEFQYGEWNDEKIISHRLDANLNANVLNKNQSITLSATMPPKDAVVSSSATFNAWIVTARANAGIRFPLDDNKREFDPFNATAIFSFGSFGAFTQRMDMNTEKREVTSLTSMLSLTKWGLDASFSAFRTPGYELDPAIGWVERTSEPTLKPKDFSLLYDKTFLQNSLWHNRVQYSLQLKPSLNFDLLRYTGSQFNFVMAYGMAISNFVEIILSFRSENAVIYRYYRELLPNDLPDSIRNADGEQYNVFTDLLNSFRFDDENRRRSSGFKMKSFDLKVVHYMGDWNATLSVGMVPYRTDSMPPKYQLNTEITFLVEWIPIEMIKTEMNYSKREKKWIID